jgi:raffinose/stachyose/melibiose transport system substrate-binding protein
MKKGLLALLAIASVALLSACGAQESTLIVFQNKIEIDGVLRDYANAWAAENGYSVVVKSCGGDACAYGTQILAEFQTANQPDIFVIEGLGGFQQYKDKILPLDGEAWTNITDLAFVVDGVTYGFPVAIEGWGMGYNATILQAAGVDPASLTTLAAYRTAFEKIEAAGFTAVSMAAGPGMTWVTGLHNFNSYLSAQLDYTDNSVIRDLQAGRPNLARLNALADWVELLFEFADQQVLLTGGYDEQVGLFARGEAAFIHQGNWIDGNLTALNVSFPIGYAPHASMPGVNDSIFIGAPSFYVINADSPNIELAKQFLNDLAASSRGHDYMVNKANMVPAFNTVTLSPATPLSAAVLSYSQRGKAYAWWQNDMPAGFGMDTLGPIYELYARGQITKAQFVSQLADQIRGLA